MNPQVECIPGRFEGKTAVVTGGASGMGEAIVRRLVAEGAQVMVGDVNAERLAQLESSLDGAVATRPTDVTVEDEVALLTAAVVERWGRLDRSFNCAGVAALDNIVDQHLADWDRCVDVCYKALFLCIKHQARQLIAQGDGGAIVNITSLSGDVPAHGVAAYSSAKAGATLLSKNAALELAEHGIRVNSISPGLVDTPMSAGVQEIPGVVDAYLGRIPIGRMGTPADIAGPALFLASDDAAYMTAANIYVDGGWMVSGYPDLRPFLTPMVENFDE